MFLFKYKIVHFFYLSRKTNVRKVILLATSDLVADQRVHRTAVTLHRNGFEIIAVGRRIKSTPKSFETEYKTHLFKLPFRKGFCFYASYNLWSLVYLLFNNFSIVQANDLDTLLAARLVCFIKRKTLVYDSHELFTEVPELINRRFTKGIWKWLENRLVPGLKHCTTVSEGVANELGKRYGVKFEVIRNLPFRKPASDIDHWTEGKTIIYQGALNLGRGLERLITSMQYIDNCKLIIVGTGDLDFKLKLISRGFSLDDRVTFLGKIPLEQLHSITCKATLGVSLEEDLGLSYHNALPNKLFDYIQAGLPVMVSDLPEMKRLVEQYEVGLVVDNKIDAYTLAQQLKQMLKDESQLLNWHKNSLSAAKELCWEKELDKLVNLFTNI